MKLTITRPTFECPPDLAPHLESVFDGEYDIPLSYSDKPPRILDIGANFGAFSIWATHRWPGAKIFAYEPHPETFEGLRKNIVNYKNVSPFCYGIGEAGMRVLYEGINNEGESSFFQTKERYQDIGQHVQVYSPILLPEAEILKMDTEGCEVEILRPLIESGRRFDAVLFEYHRTNDRRILDALLIDYVLISSHIYTYERGTCCYVNKKPGGVR